METKLEEKTGSMVAEMLLPCRAFPLKRGRSRGRKFRGVYQPLGDQEEMMELMIPYAGIRITTPMIVHIECAYKSIYQKNQHQVDIKIMSYDVDNLAKAILDNLQRIGVIEDDRLVVGLTCIKHTGPCDTTTIRIYNAKGYKGEVKTVSSRGSDISDA